LKPTYWQSQDKKSGKGKYSRSITKQVFAFKSFNAAYATLHDVQRVEKMVIMIKAELTPIRLKKLYRQSFC